VTVALRKEHYLVRQYPPHLALARTAGHVAVLRLAFVPLRSYCILLRCCTRFGRWEPWTSQTAVLAACKVSAHRRRSSDVAK